MSMIIDPNTGLTFPDGSQQSTASQPGPAFKAVLTTDQSYPGSGVTQRIEYDTITLDTDNLFSLANHEFVANRKGLYLFVVGLYLDTSITSSNTSLWFYKNGVIFEEPFYVAEKFIIGNASSLIPLDVGDAVAVAVGETNAKTIIGDATLNHFSGYFVRDLP